MHLCGVLERKRVDACGAKFDAAARYIKSLTINQNARVCCSKLETLGLSGIELRKAQTVLCFLNHNPAPLLVHGVQQVVPCIRVGVGQSAKKWQWQNDGFEQTGFRLQASKTFDLKDLRTLSHAHA